MESKVTILIPIHNGIKHTLKCIESILNSNYSNFEIVIIDDGSEDRSSEIIKSKYPEVTIIQGDGNLWWSGAMNKGLDYAFEKGTDYILLLNNDNIIKEDMISQLVLTAKNNANSIVCSKVYLLDDKERLFFAGGFSDYKKGGLYTEGCYELDSEKYNIFKKVEWCGGMGVLIPMTIAKDIGYFNNIDFPQYYGDADYFFRARQKGYSIVYNPRSICWNNREQTGIGLGEGKITFEIVKNILTSIKSNNNLKVNTKFYYKYFSKSEATKILLVRYGVFFARIIKRLLKYNLKFKSN
ncbi:glycosyltransferase family 2 protein [Anoxybacillus flavithermus]|uniref:glycosyltransferase family 2 protein n=1 Tax=Anoxybacillus flavithermus TaxID=33934 RepID=UPI001865EA02|nr:glycosyltransferase family 2 protein [Anoxybacillus flavithermus]MBE2943849.1 glycosyltransferase family 2 protein [Anoxybacillus flavithermus]MBE2952139.1 glycosyltransferase family 2 protein [Anoxybacillus flavithermus]MBE2960120.1 glycosyltransferase family 2 protein [Anoxybacillus flavithermus]